MTAEPLVVKTRGIATRGVAVAPERSTVENTHYGSVAVVSADGGLMHWVGDPAFETFTRSSLKPLQALAFVREGGPARLGWSARELALMCASHSGEAMHVETVRAMLASCGCEAGDLQCGCHVPGWYAATGQRPPPAGDWSPLEHNCSGKHAGFLAACRAHGETLADYIDPSSPVQRRVLAALGDVTGLAPHTMPVGTDGCSAPNYAMPLARLAWAYARLAQGRDSAVEGDALQMLFDAMTTHPELVSGSARSDLALMHHAPGDWVTKIGADGVQAVGIRSAGIGIAIKIADGDRAALYCATLGVLEALGFLSRGSDGHLPLELDPFDGKPITNSRGLATGRMLARFTLRSV